MKRIFAALLASTMVLGLTACAGQQSTNTASTSTTGTPAASGTAASGDAIKIGLYGPLTGPNTMNGLAMVQGAELGIAEINASGGLLGRELKLISLDDKSNAEQAVKNVTRLCEVEKVNMILASIHSTHILASADIVMKAQTPSLGMGTSPTWLQGDGKDFLFRVLPNNELTNNALIDAVKALGVTNVGIIYRADEAGNTNQKIFTELCKAANVNIIGAEAFQPNDTDMSGQLNKLIKAGMDGLICFGTTADPITILNQLKKTNYTGKVFGPESFSPYAIKEATGDASNGVIYAAPYALPKTAEEASTQAEKDFLTRFTAHFGKMPESDVAYRTYDAMMLYKKAVEDAKTVDGPKVKEALDNIDSFEGLAGTFQFKTAADQGKRGEGILTCRTYVIENGKDVLIDDAKLALIKADWKK